MELGLFSKEKVMTIPEYLDDYKHRHSRFNPKYISDIQRNEQFEKTVILALAMVLADMKMVYAVDMSQKIDKLGFMLLDIMRRLGYWTCIVMCAYEVVRSIADGEAKDIGRVSVKYVVGYLMLYALPWILDMIKEGF